MLQAQRQNFSLLIFYKLQLARPRGGSKNYQTMKYMLTS